jgi:hypothetical protein
VLSIRDPRGYIRENCRLLNMTNQEKIFQNIQKKMEINLEIKKNEKNGNIFKKKGIRYIFTKIISFQPELFLSNQYYFFPDGIISCQPELFLAGRNYFLLAGIISYWPELFLVSRNYFFQAGIICSSFKSSSCDVNLI